MTLAASDAQVGETEFARLPGGSVRRSAENAVCPVPAHRDRRRRKIDEETYSGKRLDLADRISEVKLNREAIDRGREETADLALNVFELLQTICDKLFTSPAERNSLVTARFLNCRLDDATLVCEMRKPFDALAEGLISKDSRGDRTSIELFQVSLRDWPTSLLQFVKGLEEQ